MSNDRTRVVEIKRTEKPTLTREIKSALDSAGIVAGYRRRRLLVEEVPGLYIRRLTLEDPRNALPEKETTDSRSPTPPPHICHPRSAHDRPGRGSSSYRSWLERIRNERPAYLTITSLELPESPIPLIESQASARSRVSDDSPRRNSSRDIILDEFLEKVSRIRHDNDKDVINSRSYGINDGTKRKTTRRKRVDNYFGETSECNKELASLEECTEKIVEVSAPRGHTIRSRARQQAVFKDCICSEISENLRINIREKTEIVGGSRSPSPEVTHTIRIAMKYHGQPEHNKSDSHQACYANMRKGSSDSADFEKSEKSERFCRNKNSRIREDSCCPGVNVALDFTLNCSSVELASRDISLKTAAGNATAKNDEVADQT